jgi:uncharacterized protein (TIGR00251 family)
VSARVRLRAVPNARKSEIVGVHGDAIKVKVAAPALEGRANEALVEFIAEKLGVARRDVTLSSGEKSRDKVIAVEGLDEAEARKRLLG